MAEQDNKPQQPQQPTTQNTFDGGMVKDPIDLFKKPNTYTHARNMTNYLPDGQMGGKNSEPSNVGTVSAPYTIIGRIYLEGDQWAIFSTNNTRSEIGMFTDTGNSATDTYVTLMNDTATLAAGLPGLNFNTTSLITGAARRGFECGFDVYWSDGQRNPDRVLNTAACPFTVNAGVYPNPWVQNCTTSAGCITCVNTNKIDIDQLRIAPLYSTPCLKLSKHNGGGQLPNGSYQVFVAYAMNGIKCTDYIAYSDVYSTFSHLGIGGSIDLTVSNIDDITKIRFIEMEVVVVSMVAGQVQAKKFGMYSTSQGVITIDLIDQSLDTIPIERLPISTPAIVSSDAIFSVSNYLTRVGPTERPDFNYQPLANKIVANWVAIQYPEDYYHIGGDDFGMNVGYLRGERYAFFIRWVYSTGDKSAAYAIPGLPAGTPPTLGSISGVPGLPSGTVIATGRFGGYSSTEIYPDHQPLVWGPLCGKPIMHHEFPDQSFGGLSHFNPGGAPGLGQKGSISVMGAYFTNIAPPVDNAGNVIRDIVGYEILRAVRDGHESILANGMVNNMKRVTDNIGTPQLHANYPYNDLGIDVFLTTNINNVNNGAAGNGFNSPVPGYPAGFQTDMLSFHSPDTVFNHPYLGPGQIEAVMALDGQSTGLFEQPWKHPMFKVLTNFDSWLTGIISTLEILLDAINLVKVATGGNPPEITMASTEAIPISFPFFSSNDYTMDVFGTDVATAIKVATGIANAALLLFFAPIQIATFQEQLLTILKGIIPARQYALQYSSWGEYNSPGKTGKIVIPVHNYEYIKDRMQSLGGMTINNLYRNDYVLLQTQGALPPYQGDGGSRFNLTNFNSSANDQLNQGEWYNKRIGSYYVKYRVAQTAQYGQIDSSKLVPTGCVQAAAVKAGVRFTSTVQFGGDTYINRYTEKNPMMFFNDWLFDAPEDIKYDYRNYMNVPYPMYWINNDVVNFNLINIASKNRRLDGPLNLFSGFPGSLFYVKTGFFYLFCNGMRDFFVESGINVGYRDWEDEVPKMFFDPYGSSRDFVREVFRSDIIKSNTLYKYDFSLSANRFINQYIGWAQCLRRDYNPTLAYTCFAYYPRRVAYSLPQDEEKMDDNWRLFLPNNYKNFDDRVWSIKDIHKTGALFLMEGASPFMFGGVETMPSKSGTDYTVGTGRLFEQTLQSCGNSDDSYEHGSNQSRMGVANTPYGLFWISQNAGKLFTLKDNKPFDIGESSGLKYWLLQYLPSQMLKKYPAYPLGDNPVAGVGAQLIYDSSNNMLYISKRDYAPKPGVNLTYSNGSWYSGCPPGSAYDGIDPVTGNVLCIACLCGTACCPGTVVNIGDPNYFEDASWTLSYDVKKQEFVSFHDWHPSYGFASKSTFLTVNGGGKLWRHNATTQSFCNFYGQNYPCEIEYYTNSQTLETVLQSVEWLLESYQYAPNGTDKFLNFDESFDQVMISNREQNSTLQNMQLKQWNNPYDALNYPQFIGATRTVLYSKVENKYRLNDFYDYTKDRGEFTLANTPMLTTSANGYTFTPNTSYFNLFKPWNQLKKFRYTGTRIFMRKSSLGANSLTIRYANTKNQLSPR